MAAAPMDMLRKCRDTFASYAREHRKVARGNLTPSVIRQERTILAEHNERLVAEIDATLREWG